MENNFHLISSTISDRGLNEKRLQNEDSFLDLARIGVFAVADGVGGAQAGDVASQMAMEIIGEAFANQSEGMDPEDTMTNAIKKANSAIFQMSSELAQLSTMATTVVALQITGNVATIAHVGDSRLYRCDPEGQLFRETQDHSVVEEEVRAGRMTAEQALTHPSRNVISRALGAESDVEVDMKIIMIEPHTTFLICSDGVTRHIPDEEISYLLNLRESASSITSRIKAICFERGAEDNLTAVVVKVSDEVAPQIDQVADDGDFDTVTTTRAEIFEDLETEPLAFIDDADRPENVREGSVLDQENTEASQSRDSLENAEPSLEQQVPIREVVVREETSSSGSKLLTAVLCLILGGVIGFIASHLFSSNYTQQVVVEPTPVLQPQTDNIALSSFEKQRRLVDEDPVDYLAKVTTPPADTEDFFLRGRALLKTGKFFDAKQAFTEVRNRINEIDPANRKTILEDLILAEIVLDNPTAQRAYIRSMSLVETEASPTPAASPVASPTPNAAEAQDAAPQS